MDSYEIFLDSVKILSKKTGKNKSELIREGIDLLIVQATDLAKNGELVPPTPLQGLTKAISDEANKLAKAS